MLNTANSESTMQMTLDVDTIQPNEAFLVYLNIEAQYDGRRLNPEYDANEMYGFSPVSKYLDVRVVDRDRKLEGVVTDDHSLRTVRSRFIDYANNIRQRLLDENTAKPDGSYDKRVNYSVRVWYTVEKIRHIKIDKI